MFLYLRLARTASTSWSRIFTVVHTDTSVRKLGHKAQVVDGGEPYEEAVIDFEEMVEIGYGVV